MQQLKRRQAGFVEGNVAKGAHPKAAQTKIETISSSGNIKIALKSQTSGDAANAQPKRKAPVTTSTAATPSPQPTPTTLFSDPLDDAAVQRDGRSTTPTFIAIAAAGVLALGALSVSLFGGGETPQSEAVAAGHTISEDLSRLVVASASAAEAQTGGVDPETTGTALPGDASEDMVAKMTAGTLAALRSGTASRPAETSAAADTGNGSALYHMVMKAHAQGQSEAYIDRLLNEAHSRKDIEVPAGLIDADGRVDTATILSLFIQK